MGAGVRVQGARGVGMSGTPVHLQFADREQGTEST